MTTKQVGVSDALKTGIEEEPHSRPECDHMVGYHHIALGQELILGRQLVTLKRSGDIYIECRFSFCPLCGIKLWENYKDPI